MFEREDWKLFRSLETLPQRAGVARELLGALVAKEIADNALDVSAMCTVGMLEGGGFFVHDEGPGIDG